MSRIGNQPVTVPGAAKVKVEGQTLVAEGPKGKVSTPIPSVCSIDIDGDTLTVARSNNSGQAKALHGLTRSLVQNAVVGVVDGFVKELEVVGVGYRGDVSGRQANFSLGFSHPVEYKIPDGIDIEIDKNNKITVRGADRQKVGQVAAEIRSLRPPDPYKAKGIRYSGEQIRRKVGKAGAR